LHARTRNQAFSGKADWSLIKKVKENVKIPVIGNGDVTSIEDYRRMIRETGCDAVMVGRGAMGRPWIFRLDGEKTYIPSLEEVKSTLLRHYSLSIEHYGEGKAIREMRKHLSWYTRGIQGGSGFRKTINGMTSLEDILREIEMFFTLEKEKIEASLV
ncbi:MAG: tRNA-dihydrouridine synthase, partial [Spirochaetota bacterium]|nr:tRNA-dihydrouridine synthase [Spirochaetota bacterium]